MDPKLERKMQAEHVAKYAALAKTLGEDSLGVLVQPLVTRCADALKAGDEHLNTIPLAVWDRLASVPDSLGPKCCGKYCHTPFCPQCGKAMRKPTAGRDDWPYADLRESARDLSLPWHRARGLSLSERVCLLKYVATKLAQGN